MHPGGVVHVLGRNDEVEVSKRPFSNFWNPPDSFT